jgi:hypothetical protein
MADSNDKVVKQLAPTEMEHIKKWRKKFIQPFDEGEVTTLLRYSQTVEKLWCKHVEQQQRIRERTSNIVPVFGQEETMKQTAWTTTQEKDKILQQELLSENVRKGPPPSHARRIPHGPLPHHRGRRLRAAGAGGQPDNDVC